MQQEKGETSSTSSDWNEAHSSERTADLQAEKNNKGSASKNKKTLKERVMKFFQRKKPPSYAFFDKSFASSQREDYPEPPPFRPPPVPLPIQQPVKLLCDVDFDDAHGLIEYQTFRPQRLFLRKWGYSPDSISSTEPSDNSPASASSAVPDLSGPSRRLRKMSDSSPEQPQSKHTDHHRTLEEMLRSAYAGHGLPGRPLIVDSDLEQSLVPPPKTLTAQSGCYSDDSVEPEELLSSHIKIPTVEGYLPTDDISYGSLDPFDRGSFSKYGLKKSSSPAPSRERSPDLRLGFYLDSLAKGGNKYGERSESKVIVHNNDAGTSDFSLRGTKAESGGGADAVVELEAAVAAVNCSVTNTQPIQTCPSGPSQTEGVSGSLFRSHSSPSLSHMTSAENRTLTRAQSLPDLQLNCSCEQFTPDITADEEDETYRFQCSSPGLYQCSVTGLVFHMEREGDLVYRTLPWNRKLLSQHHKQPAGPLFDIKCEQQSVCQLHLPHCEIHSTGGADFLSVAHLDEENIEFVGPHKITETHVIINITGFSAYGNVKDEDAPPDPVRALVLVFYRPPADPDPTSLFNVMLLPRNVAFRDVLRYRKKLDGDECYIETSPHCKLQPQQEYSLSTCPEDDSVLVEPTTAEFDSDNYDNYFPSFQVTLEKTMTHLKLILRDNNSSKSVWERRVCLSSSRVQRSCGQSALTLPPNQRLFDIRSSFIAGISGPVLKSLLDKLLEKTVMTDSEVESADEMRNRGDKARFVIDTVRNKGEAASSEMMEALCDLDPFFSDHLGLT